MENGSDSEDSVLSDVGMSVLKARSCRGQEGFDELGLSQLAEEAKGVASNVFVGVLKIVTDTVAIQT